MDRRRYEPSFVDDLIGWLLIVGMLGGAALLLIVLGCAHVPSSELCTTDSRPVTPEVRTFLQTAKVTIKCYPTPERSSTAIVEIRSSPWIWSAVGTAVGALAAALVADRGEPSDGRTVLVDRRPATRGLARGLRADEGDPPWLLWPALDRWWYPHGWELARRH
jgi:hypothetical protein